MIKLSAMPSAFVLPLVFVMFWQGGSCREKKMNNNKPQANASSASKEMGRRAPVGSWGGLHIRLELTESGAEIEYDCAHGTMDGPLVLGSDGRFNLTGTHFKEHSGPIRLNEPPNDHPARYTGRVEGQTMTLQVTLTDTQEDAGTFTLTHGVAGRVWKCR